MFKKAVPLVLISFFILFTVWLSPSSANTVIFFDNFNDNYDGWSESGLVDSHGLVSLEPNAVRMRKDGMIWRTISTVGYTDIAVTWTMAARSLENNEWCYVEYNTGDGWVLMASLGNGDDDSVFRSDTVNMPAAADNNPNFQLRYRIIANAVGDYCYAEDTTVSGTTAGGSPTNTPAPTATATATPSGPTPTPTATPTGGSGVPGDPLTGSGDVSRSWLTYSDLMSGSSTAPVDDGAFALPAAAAHPLHTFEGRLELHGEATGGGFQTIKDSYNYANNSERKHIPEFDVAFVQNGSHLIPVQRGLIITAHPYWDYIIGPGRAWQENGDNGYTRASFPFALVQKNANCTHNGVMTFLFNGSDVSNVRYQITQETCLYFKFNMWGQLNATYHAEPVNDAAQIKAAYAQEAANRFPTQPFAQLALDYPGTDLSRFGSGITPAHMTAYGLVINGVNYVSGCGTRYGEYAYCAQMRLPSYSTAKSIFAGMALMRLGQKYGSGVYDLKIIDYVPEAAGAGNWSNVTFNNTIDMATGHYRFLGYMSDEGGVWATDFFLAESYNDKMTQSLRYNYRTTPGTTWVYHTSDTFIVTRAMHNYLQAQEGSGKDIYEMVMDELFVPLKVGPGAYTSRRTSENNWQGQAWGGYGLFWTQDDVAKIVTLLNNDGGVVGGTQLLHPQILADAMQKNPNDRGLTTANQPFMYNNGFWAREFTPAQFPEYNCTFWTPFMSGYGGITVVMMPNGSTYYYFSDNDEFAWFSAVSESNNILSHCP
jgi:hypothetical protein